MFPSSNVLINSVSIESQSFQYHGSFWWFQDAVCNHAEWLFHFYFFLILFCSKYFQEVSHFLLFLLAGPPSRMTHMSIGSEAQKCVRKMQLFRFMKDFQTCGFKIPFFVTHTSVYPFHLFSNSFPHSVILLTFTVSKDCSQDFNIKNLS